MQGFFQCNPLSFLMLYDVYTCLPCSSTINLSRQSHFDVDKLPLTMCLLSVSQEEILLRRKAGSLPRAYHDANGQKKQKR